MTTKVHRVAALADDHGCLTMLAVDHRESLRTMLGHGERASEEDARSFKMTAIDALGGAASAILLDTETALAASCDRPVVLAADVYDQPPGSPVLGSRLDERVDVDLIRATGAVAVKLLVLWRPDGGAADEVSRLVELAQAAGVASLVEGIVSGVSADERDDAVLAAAAELCACGPDVYKAQLPGYVPGDLSRVREESVRLAAVVGRPWVVLSNGVRPEDFTAGVGEACAGGASGFLAGRAVWSGAANATNPARELRSGAVRRLHGMIDVAHRSVSAGRLR